MAESLTPMFRQYRSIKRQYPDVILFFRLGDFYEMFEEDAEVASRELDLVLTARPESPKSGKKIPMCGVPVHAVDRYVARLIARGHRVAICDQMEDPALAKSLVRREVTRVVTPGTIVEDSMLEARANNYLVAVAVALPSASGVGLAVCDLSTGEFAVTEFAGEEATKAAAEELLRLSPAEILLPEEAEAFGPTLLNGASIPITPLKAEVFSRRMARETLLRHFGVQSLHGFGCEEMPLAIEAAAAILCYLKETKLPAVEHIRSLATYSTSAFMTLDATARRNLELVQSMWEGGRSRTLLSVLDQTTTAMGGRLLKRWLERPLIDVAAINARLDAVEELFRSAMVRGELREALSKIADLERLISRCATGTANARDLVALRASLEALSPVKQALVEARAARLAELRERIDLLEEVVELIARAIADDPPAALREGNLIRDGYNDRLDQLRATSRDGKKWIADLEARERERTGIKSLKVGYNDVFKYYIEVTKPNVAYVPDNYERRQTTANTERYVTTELKEKESQILGAEKRAVEMEYTLFCGVRDQVGRAAARVLATAAAIAELDVLASFAETAARHGYTRPLVDDGPILQIRNGRHPVVERLGTEPFVPNDLLMDDQENRLLVITGPNMSGKCLKGDSLVVTSCGLVCLADLMPSGARVGEFTEVDFEVHGLTGRRRATRFYRGGRQPTVKVTSRLGYTIEGTPQHRLWVRNPDGSEGWKCVGELAEGDLIALKPGTELWGNQTWVQAPSAEAARGSGRYRLPEELEEDLAYLMGLLVGSGTLTRPDSFRLTTADPFLAEEFRRIMAEQFGYLAVRRAACGVRRKAGAAFTLGGVTRSTEHLAPNTERGAEGAPGHRARKRSKQSVFSRQIRLYLADLGLGYHRFWEKCVPQSILRAPRPIVVAFLQGLFDADGSAQKKCGSVRLSTASARLAREVQLLLLNLGVIASLCVSEATRRAPDHRPADGGAPEHRAWKRSDLPPKQTYLLKIEGVAPQSGFFYDRVAAIEPGEAEVYDLNVEGEHAYVAGGFVSHNSTYLRQAALIVLMAQAGSMVPADAAQIGVVDRIFTRVGAHDDLASGQSTFMVEMNETANILNNATRRSLVILDEIGRGTSTYDGLSIAWAVAEYLQQLAPKTLFATHYHHLNDLAERLPGVKNFRVAVREDGHRIIWLHKIVPGGTDKSYGIQVARLAGLPEAVIQRAREVLEELEQGSPRDRRGRDGVPGIGAERRETSTVQGAPTRRFATLPDAQVRISTRSQRLQLTLFEAEEHPVLEALRRLDLTTITPIEALTLLSQWQKKLP